MPQNNLQRLINLAQKTGDTLIVTDESGHEPVVIMDVAKYEALLDIGLFADDSEVSYEDPVTDVSEIEDFEPPMEVYAPELKEDVATEYEEIAQEDPHPAMDSVIDQDNGDDDGEERFYLEPIE